MEFVIIGAGAIGGSMGAYLARAGHEVLLVESDAAHVQAMQSGGLRIEGRSDFTHSDGASSAITGACATA